jgi:TolA-binding protein
MIAGTSDIYESNDYYEPLKNGFEYEYEDEEELIVEADKASTETAENQLFELNERVEFLRSSLQNSKQTIEDYEDEFTLFDGKLFEKRRLCIQPDLLRTQVNFTLIFRLWSIRMRMT